MADRSRNCPAGADRRTSGVLDHQSGDAGTLGTPNAGDRVLFPGADRSGAVFRPDSQRSETDAEAGEFYRQRDSRAQVSDRLAEVVSANDAIAERR